METKQHAAKIKTNQKKWVNEVKKEIRKHLETNESKNTTLQNLWHAAKAVPRTAFSNIIAQAFLKKEGKSQRRSPAT